MRFKHHQRLVPEKILKLTITHDGYLRVELNKNNRPRKFTIHRLVAFAFLSNYANKKAVNHIDGNKKNNKTTNLEWVSNKENTHHGFATGLIKVSKGESHVRSKLTKLQVIEIRNKFNSGEYKNQTKVAPLYGFSRGTINSILRNKNWKQV